MLFRALYRSKVDRWTLDRLGNSLRVGRIVLLALDKRLNILRWNQLDLMAKLCNLASPVMRAAASLQANEAGFKTSKKLKDLPAAQPLAKHRLSRLIRTVNLKHRLCQIKPDRCNHSHERFSRWINNAYKYASSRGLRGAFHQVI